MEEECGRLLTAITVGGACCMGSCRIWILNSSSILLRSSRLIIHLRALTVDIGLLAVRYCSC